MTIEKEYKIRYSYYKKIYGIEHSLFTQMYETFNPCMFYRESRKQVIAMYLELEGFVNDIKKYNLNVPYYFGIDNFLKEYKTAVYNCLKEERI